MDQPTPVILSVSVPEFEKIVIETSEDKRYFADLKNFRKVYCYPKNLDEWKKVSIDPHGFGLIWSCRFEVHVDQVIGLANKVEQVSQPATG